MPATLKMHASTRLAAAAVLALASCQAFGGNGNTAELGAAYVDPVDRPQLVHRYRSPFGLKLSGNGSSAPGKGRTATQWLARVADTQDAPEPLVYSVARVPSALGLRGAEQAAGIVLRSGTQWASSFELSSAEDAVTAGRRIAVQGQLHTSLAGGIGLSAGIRLSGLNTPAYLGNSGTDTPYANGYVLQAGRSDLYAQQLGYQLQLNYLYGERNTVALSYVSRREADQFGLGSDPALSEGSLLSVMGEHWFSPSWALRYDIPTPESSSLIRRQGLRLGLHYRF